ncbi:adhesion G protein-coupled receptor F5-like [Ara ararauna]
MSYPCIPADPCLNGGSWIECKCKFADGFYGEFCQFPICRNGGIYSNGFCFCPGNFQGTECQEAKDSIEVKDVLLDATVGMKTKVENREFTPELQNKSSASFQAFEKEFKEQMRDLYKHIEGYQDVVIHELTQGSIVVNYMVLLKVPASTKANETLKTISNELINAITSSTTCNESCEGDNFE